MKHLVTILIGVMVLVVVWRSLVSVDSRNRSSPKSSTSILRSRMLQSHGMIPRAIKALI
jgi:hypothetical protein